MTDILKLNKVKKILNSLSSDGLLTEQESEDVKYILDICEHPEQTPITRIIWSDSVPYCKNCHHEILDKNQFYCSHCGQRFHRISGEAAYIAYVIANHDSSNPTICKFCRFHSMNCPDALPKDSKPICSASLEDFLFEHELVSSENLDYKEFLHKYFKSGDDQ